MTHGGLDFSHFYNILTSGGNHYLHGVINSEFAGMNSGQNSEKCRIGGPLFSFFPLQLLGTAAADPGPFRSGQGWQRPTPRPVARQLTKHDP